MRYVNRAARLLTAAFAFLWASQVLAVDYVLQRVTSGLAQPMFLQQAPGDTNPNVVYYAERITAAAGSGGGFSVNNPMGKIWRVDLSTVTKANPLGDRSLVLDLSAHRVLNDEGLQGFTFSPDFNIAGAPGYQQLYVSYSEHVDASGNPSTDTTTRPAKDSVERFTYNGASAATSAGIILQYRNNTQENHTVDWVGFDPTTFSHPVGTADRNYLFITTGDGSYGLNTSSRPAQKPNDNRGKLLRVDVDSAHGDSYTGDALRNFAIPASNPIPAWNAAHPAAMLDHVTIVQPSTQGGTQTYGTATTLNGEVYATGLRNAFRMSFDHQTGDIWFGDVGEDTREEVDFLKAKPSGYDGTTPPADFGWSQREGMTASVINSGSGAVVTSPSATTLTWNTSAASSVVVNSFNPIREGTHTAGRSAFIGGYVYHGAIASLANDYFFADYVRSNAFMISGFDRNTDVSQYTGTNGGALGTLTQVASGSISSLWNTLIIDPHDPTYTSALGAAFGIGRITSFAEDNSGNMYVIDFGGTRGDTSFGQDYPNAGRGQIFKLVPVPGDFDRSGSINVGDVSAMMGALNDLDAYGTTYVLNETQLREIGDVNGDANVNNTDLQSLIVYLANTGGGSGSLVAVPEPASRGLLIIGVVSLLIFARNRPGRHIRLLA